MIRGGIDERRDRAKNAAVKPMKIIGELLKELDPAKVANATENALVGTPEDVVEQISTFSS